MTDQLSGRALDEAVTVAMGGQIVAGGRVSANGGRCGLQRYSTDPARIDEMLAWLRQHGTVEMFADDSCGFRARIYPQAHQFDLTHQGDTLSEALARLVVAASKAKGAK